MKINPGNLIKSLDIIKEISKTNLRSEENAVMFAFGQVIAENGRSYISTQFDHDLSECILPFDKLYTLASSFSASSKLKLKEADENIRLEFEKDDKVSKTKIAVYFDKTFHYIDPPDDDWQSLPYDFIQALKKCNISLPKESLNHVLTSYGIKDDRIITSDDFRASQYTMEEGFDKDFILPPEIAQLAIKNGFSEYMIGDNTISFRTDEIFARAALSNDEYPTLGKDIFEYDEHIEVVKKDILEAIDRSTLFADGLSEIDYMVTIEITDKILTINAKNNFGKNTEIVNITSKCETKTLHINPTYLAQVLRILTQGDIEIGITKNNALIFSEGNFKHLLATYVQ